MTETIKELIIAIKGAGEMATGVAWRLFQSNFKNIFMMEIENPMAVRRRVSFCEVVHNDKIDDKSDEKIIVEGVEAKKVLQPDDFSTKWDNNCIPVIVDPN